MGGEGSMHFIVLTLYPEMFTSFLTCGLLGKAQEEGNIRIETVNFRKHGIGKHHSVDAPPYGGGAGMLLRVEPIVKTLEECEEGLDGPKPYKILLSPQGEPLVQSKVRQLSSLDRPIVLICGRFEGFDQRIRYFVDEEIGVGDFIMMGGEVAAMAIIEAVCRLIPGVIGNDASLAQESFSNQLLEYSQFTRPMSFKGHRVPEILVSGDHGRVAQWRLQDAIAKTRARRMDLFQQYRQGQADG
jgi:tRNA (guanine37-N1)-methyltransferase